MTTDLRSVLAELADEAVPVDLSERVRRQARTQRRRRAGAAVGATVAVVAAAAIVPAHLLSRTASKTASTPPTSWRIAYTLNGMQQGVDVRDGTGQLVHHFERDDVALSGGFDLAQLTPDGSLLLYTDNEYGFDVVRAHRSDGSPDPALDGKPVGAAFGQQRVIYQIEAAPDDKHVALMGDFGLASATVGVTKEQAIVTRADGSVPADSASIPVVDAAWSPDGLSLAFATGVDAGRPGGSPLASHSLYVWDEATGTDTLVDTGSSPKALAWSHSGSLAWFTANGQAKVRTGDTVHTLATGLTFKAATESASLSWSPDDKRLAVSADQLRLVSVVNGDQTVVPQRGPDAMVVWLPDGTLLVSGYNASNVPPATNVGAPRVFDATGHQLRQFPTDEATITDWTVSFGSPAR